MTHDELTELIDLYVSDELPSTLRAHVETYLAAHPEAAQEAATLRTTIARLKAAPRERPDPWFVERALDGLLREHTTGQTTEISHKTHKK